MINKLITNNKQIKLHIPGKFSFTIYGVNKASIFLNCTTYILNKAIKLGYIYLPNSFISKLNNDIYENYPKLIEIIDIDEEKSSLSYKPTFKESPDHTKVFVELIKREKVVKPKKKKVEETIYQL
jgi:hypothetical protein